MTVKWIYFVQTGKFGFKTYKNQTTDAPFGSVKLSRMSAIETESGQEMFDNHFLVISKL
jgi:hypothetical protein